jgi:hypothetical protein
LVASWKRDKVRVAGEDGTEDSAKRKSPEGCDSTFMNRTDAMGEGERRKWKILKSSEEHLFFSKPIL